MTIDTQYTLAMAQQPHSTEAMRARAERERLEQLRRDYRTRILSQRERAELERLEAKRR